MPGRGASLLVTVTRGFQAGAWAAGGATSPELTSLAAPAAAAVAAMGVSTTTGTATAARSLLQALTALTVQGLRSSASVVAQDLSTVPWVCPVMMRLWRSGPSSSAPSRAVSHGLAETWRRSTMHSVGLCSAAAVRKPAVAAVSGTAVSGAEIAMAAELAVAPQAMSRRPLGLLAGVGRRLTAPGVMAGAVVGTAAIVATTPWAPLAGAPAVRSVWRDSRGYEHFQGRGHAWSAHNPRLMYGTAALAAAAAAYYFYSLETVPYTGRRHAIMLVSPYREQWMGQMGFEQFKALARAEHKLLPESHPDVHRVARLGRAIAAVAADGGGGGQWDHMRGLQWEFAVVQDPMVNAAVLPGGKVIVFSGLLRLLDRNDDELAAVMAHEVGHVLARHPAEKMSTLNVWLLLNTALRLALGFALPDVAMYLALILPNSRKNEHEADMIGLRLMARACFDPAAATSMLDKLNRAEMEMKQGHVFGGSLPPFLSTHPLTTDRVKLLERDLPEAYKLFEEAGCASARSDLRRGLEAWLGGGWGGRGDAGGGFRSL